MSVRFLCSQVESRRCTESPAPVSHGLPARSRRTVLVHPVVPGHLRVERGREQVALPDRDDPTGGRTALDPASTSTPAPTSSTHGARMNTARTGVRRLRRSRHVQVLLEGVDLPAEGVAPHRDVETAEGLLVGPGVGDAVGQHDHPGARAVGRHARRRAACAAARCSSNARTSLSIVVDSPPGITSAVDVVELRAAGAPVGPRPAGSRAPRRCSRTSPWTARTPMLTGVAVTPAA